MPLKEDHATGLSLHSPSLGGRMTDPVFRALFDATPTPLVVLAPPDWTIVAANDARLKITGDARHEQIGVALFEQPPDNPQESTTDGERALKASLERVVASGIADVIPVQSHAIRASGSFVGPGWRSTNSPVFDEDGKVSSSFTRLRK